MPKLHSYDPGEGVILWQLEVLYGPNEIFGLPLSLLIPFTFSSRMRFAVQSSFVYPQIISMYFFHIAYLLYLICLHSLPINSWPSDLSLLLCKLFNEAICVSFNLFLCFSWHTHYFHVVLGVQKHVLRHSHLSFFLRSTYFS